MLDDAQIASIKERLHLTPDQEQMWPAVEAALRNIAYTRAQRRAARGVPAGGAQLAADVDPESVAGPQIRGHSADHEFQRRAEARGARHRPCHGARSARVAVLIWTGVARRNRIFRSAILLQEGLPPAATDRRCIWRRSAPSPQSRTARPIPADWRPKSCRAGRKGNRRRRSSRRSRPAWPAGCHRAPPPTPSATNRRRQGAAVRPPRF